MTIHLPHTLPPSTPLLVAFSGGADSRLLLELAVEYGKQHGAPVSAAHLHHGIRGEEADRDEAFCKQVAAMYGIPIYTERVDIPARASRSGHSLELEARLARYDFFARVMTEHAIPVLLTAHNADDQLETLLLRLLRGTGTRGMGGIPPVRDIPGGVAIRPLLDMTKADILAECRARGLDYVTDSTNLADDCTRNRIRHEVIPALEAIAGGGIPQASALRLARAAREDDACLTDLAQAHLDACQTDDGGVPLIDLHVLDNAIARRMIALAYAAAVPGAADGDGSRSLTATHLDAMLALCDKGAPNSEITLPGGYRAHIRGEELIFLSPDDRRRPSPPSSCAVPIVEGDTLWDEGRMIIRCTYESCTAPPPPDSERTLATARFPADTLPLPLWARRRTPGDHLFSHGMNKKLKKLLCDKHISRELRDRLPLICTDGGLTPLWFPLAGFRDGYPPPTTGIALRITVLWNDR